MAHQVGGEPHAVKGGQGVGRGVLDDAVGVEADQPVAHAGRGVHLQLLVREREGAGRDHLGEVGGALEVGELQPARGAHGEEVGVAGDDAENAPLAPYGDRLDPHGDLLAPLRVALAHDAALVQGRVEHGPAAARHQMAHHVVLVGGRAGVGAHLRDGDVAGAVPGGDPQDQVGEGEVGEQLPLRDQQMEPLEIGVVEGCVLAYELVHGGHVSERTRGSVPPPETPAGRGAWEGPSTLFGTAARSCIGRGVCGPGRPKVEEPGQSGQRAPDPRSAFLCGEGRLTVFPTHCGLDHCPCKCAGTPFFAVLPTPGRGHGRPPGSLTRESPVRGRRGGAFSGGRPPGRRFRLGGREPLC